MPGYPDPAALRRPSFAEPSWRCAREEAVVEVAREIMVGGVSRQRAVDRPAGAISEIDPAHHGCRCVGGRGERCLALAERTVAQGHVVGERRSAADTSGDGSPPPWR